MILSDRARPEIPGGVVVSRRTPDRDVRTAQGRYAGESTELRRTPDRRLIAIVRDVEAVHHTDHRHGSKHINQQRRASRGHQSCKLRPVADEPAASQVTGQQAVSTAPAEWMFFTRSHSAHGAKPFAGSHIGARHPPWTPRGGEAVRRTPTWGRTALHSPHVGPAAGQASPGSSGRLPRGSRTRGSRRSRTGAGRASRADRRGASRGSGGCRGRRCRGGRARR